MVIMRDLMKSDNKPIHIIDHIYVGSIGSAHNLQALQAAGITHILTVGPNLPQPYKHFFSYKHIELLDSKTADLLSALPESFSFIESSRLGRESSSSYSLPSASPRPASSQLAQALTYRHSVSTTGRSNNSPENQQQAMNWPTTDQTTNKHVS